MKFLRVLENRMIHPSNRNLVEEHSRNEEGRPGPGACPMAWLPTSATSARPLHAGNTASQIWFFSLAFFFPVNKLARMWSWVCGCKLLWWLIFTDWFEIVVLFKFHNIFSSYFIIRKCWWFSFYAARCGRLQCRFPRPFPSTWRRPKRFFIAKCVGWLA